MGLERRKRSLTLECAENAGLQLRAAACGTRFLRRPDTGLFPLRFGRLACPTLSVLKGPAPCRACRASRAGLGASESWWNAWMVGGNVRRTVCAHRRDRCSRVHGPEIDVDANGLGLGPGNRELVIGQAPNS